MGTSQSRNRLIGGANLIRAASRGNTATVRRLLALRRQLGININKRNRYGNTALIYAASFAHADIVELLLAAGANVNVQNRLGDTALISAAREGYADIVRLLLAVPGIDVNAQNNIGATALIPAAHNGYVDIVRLLLAAGADVNPLDYRFETALMVAERRGHTDVVRAINSFFAEQAMNRWIPRHRSRQRDRFGLSELDRGTPFMDLVYYHTQGFL